MDDKTFEEILEQVQRPARYLGSEWNAVKKDIKNADVKFALCFPDLYEIGMSHLGFKLIYHLLNEREDIACERVFAPALDMEGLLRKRRLPLFSLESRLPVGDFDILGFSLAYEMAYTSALNVLELSGIPLRSRERGSASPLVIAGGISSFNPEPMSEFIDAFIIGEAEEAILELIDSFKAAPKRAGREELLKRLSRIRGVYVPSLYKADYAKDGTINRFSPISPSAPSAIEKRFIKDLDKSFYPAKQIVPFTRIIHDRISVEIMRGCPNKCRFCQAWVSYHHKRERSPSRILELCSESEGLTGYEEISLLSLSSGDHSRIKEIIPCLVDKFESRGISVSLPSLRVDKAFAEFPSSLSRLGTKGLTFAPEAGSERLRAVINKDIRIEHLAEIADKLRKTGWRKVKLYFMIGLPGEEYGDLDAIAQLVGKLKGGINVSISSFIPKPHTPFQWERMQPLEELRKRFYYIKDRIRSRRAVVKMPDPNLSFLEGILSRGDRRVSRLIYGAFKRGARLDSWTEQFRFSSWLEAFEESGVDPNFYIYRKRSYEEILPWDHINTGISKGYLIEESQKANSLI